MATEARDLDAADDVATVEPVSSLEKDATQEHPLPPPQDDVASACAQMLPPLGDDSGQGLHEALVMKQREHAIAALKASEDLMRDGYMEITLAEENIRYFEDIGFAYGVYPRFSNRGIFFDMQTLSNSGGRSLSPPSLPPSSPKRTHFDESSSSSSSSSSSWWPPLSYERM